LVHGHRIFVHPMLCGPCELPLPQLVIPCFLPSWVIQRH
jgi:hypothetical protein